jgi:hypothetical protein
MKLLASLVVAAAMAASLSACETYHGGGPYAGVYVDGYYDDAYGPFYDGYWGDGGVFYYRPAPDAAFVPDSAHHFRRDRSDGYHTFHMHAGHAPENRG